MFSSTQRFSDGSTMDMCCPDHCPKVAPSYTTQEDEETCVDSGSSFVGDEEVSCGCPSEEEGEAVNAVGCASPEQHSRFEDASEQQKKPSRTKLSSTAMVFIPGATTTSMSGTQPSTAGREILTLLKGNSKQDCPSGQQSEVQRKPGRSKLSSSANLFVPQAAPQATFTPQQNVVQLTGANPVLQLFPVLLMPTQAAHDGFDDSPRAAYLDNVSQQENTPKANGVHCDVDEGHFPAIQQSVESTGAITKSPPKISWADLYEDEYDLGPDLWLGTRTGNELLSLS